MSLIDTHINRTRRNLKVVAIVFIVGTLIGLGAAHRYLANYFHGPVNMTADELAKIGDPDKLSTYWVNVTGSKYLDSGVYEVTINTNHGVETSRHNSAYYGILAVGDKMLIVRQEHPVLERDEGEIKMTGSLEALDKKERSNVRKNLVDQEADLAGSLTEYKLDTENFKTGGNIGLTVSAIVVLFGLILLFKSRAPADRHDHAIVKQLAQFGDPRALAAQLDAQIPAGANVKGIVTPDFVVWQAPFGLTIIPTKDLIWAHIHKKGRVFSVNYYLRSGKLRQEGGISQAKCQEMLGEIDRKAPWVFIGFDGRLQTAWKKDRANMIASVDKRRLEGAQVAPTAKNAGEAAGIFGAV